MNRRGFLNGILATAIAPAIVRSESLMKIWVPSQEIIQVHDSFLFPPKASSVEIADFMNRMWAQHIKDIEAAIWYGTKTPLYAKGPLTQSLVNEVAQIIADKK